MTTGQEKEQKEERKWTCAWRFLRHKVFRALWIATFFSNTYLLSN
jgi:hypothetical protein